MWNFYMLKPFFLRIQRMWNYNCPAVNAIPRKGENGDGGGGQALEHGTEYAGYRGQPEASSPGGSVADSAATQWARNTQQRAPVRVPRAARQTVPYTRGITQSPRPHDMETV